MSGAARHGDQVTYIQTDRYAGVQNEYDAAACYGVRASTRIILDAYRRAGKRTLFFDKGYWGRGVYTRMAIDAWHSVGNERSDERLKASGLKLIERDNWQCIGPVIYAATTQTWHDFYDLGPARALDELLIRLLVGIHGDVIYRPRPAYAKKHPELCGPISGARLSDRLLAEELEICSLLVTIGSNAAIEAVAADVRVLVLGDNPCNSLNEYASRSEWLERRQVLFANLAWRQWTIDEYLSGVAWAAIKERFA